MNIKTDQKLKLAIAQTYPNLISIHKLHVLSFYWTPKNKTDNIVNVTEQEWDYIVHLLESRLEASDHLNYIRYLRMYHEQHDDLKTIHWFAGD